MFELVTLLYGVLFAGFGCSVYTLDGVLLSWMRQNCKNRFQARGVVLNDVFTYLCIRFFYSKPHNGFGVILTADMIYDVLCGVVFGAWLISSRI